MRLFRLTLGDIHFHWKYGFYFLYAIITLLYSLILSGLPQSIRTVGGTILILTDPAALGLFFMGAIVLLERSQHTLQALFCSPVQVWEYLTAKTVSLSAVGVLVGLVLCLVSRPPSLPMALLGLALGSLFYALVGLILACNSHSLNGFILLAVPAELLLLVPGVLQLLGMSFPLARFHPGVITGALLLGQPAHLPIDLLAMALWIGAAWCLALHTMNRTRCTLGGEEK